MLCAVGDLVEDVVVQLHGEVRRDTDTPATILRRRGGSAANAAYFAAHLAGRSRFVGCIGDDPLGDLLVAQLRCQRVDVRGERRGRTGSIVVIAGADGERTMLTDRGSAPELLEFDPAWLDGVTALHVPLYSLAADPLAAAARAAATMAGERGILVSVDLSSVTVIEDLGAPAVRLAVAGLRPDVLFCTQAEASAAGIDPHERGGARLVVVKDGPRPVRTFGDGVATQEFPVDPVGDVLDGTGAGDAFAAAFLVARTGGGSVAEAVVAGQTLGARVLARAGATLGDE